MELNFLPKPGHHASVTLRRQLSAGSTSTSKISNQVQPQAASPELITNLITSLSSMPTLTAQLSSSTENLSLTPPVSPRVGSISNSTSLNKFGSSQSSSNRSISCGGRGEDYYGTCKLSSSGRSHGEHFFDQFTSKSSPRISTTASSPSFSEFSSAENLSRDSFTSFPFPQPPRSSSENRSKSRVSVENKTGSIGNPRIESRNAPCEQIQDSPERWRRKQRRVASRSPNDNYREKQRVMKNTSTESPEKFSHSKERTRLDQVSPPMIRENEASITTEASKNNTILNSSGSISIPTRESSLPHTSSSKKRPSHNSRLRKTSDGVYNHTPKLRSTSQDRKKEKKKKSSDRVIESLNLENLAEILSKNSDLISNIPTPTDVSSPSLKSISFSKNLDQRSRNDFNISGNGSPEILNTKRKNRLSRQLSPSMAGQRNSRVISTEKIYTEDRPSSARSIDEAVDAYICSSRLSQKIRHPQTGRIISFSEVGDSDGFAVFCCVGMGLTRFVTAFYDELATTLKLRLITPDRPGVGDSEPYADGTSTPLNWPAHSAGAIYALATALRMPQQIRGRIHLLAPWIPPSQMTVIGGQVGLPRNNYLPTSQRILRVIPTPILRAANSSFMSSATSSMSSGHHKQRRAKRKSVGREFTGLSGVNKENLKNNPLLFDDPTDDSIQNTDDAHLRTEAAILAAAANSLAVKERQVTYESRLTHAIWNLATQGANPAVDLLVCLERRHTIGFRYVDITRSVVIHHGSKDTRVPVENVQWMGKTMKRCDVRVLEGEGHSLMASASVMSSILVEISKEWEDWMKVTNSTPGHRNEGTRKSLRERASIGAFR